jgi:iron complex transport system permease protein
MSKVPPYPTLLILLIAAVAGLFAASLLTGPSGIGVRESLSALFDHNADLNATALVMREIRLPRAILGLTIGASLGLAGAVLQGYLRNPLAEPGLVGVSSAAALGAVLAFYTGLAGLAPLALPIMALIGAMVAVAMVFAIAGRRGSSVSVILAGIAVSSLAGALVSLTLNLSPNPFAAYEIMFWLLGSLADRSMDHVAVATPFMIIGWVLLALTAPSLNALTLGEDAATTLGVRLGRLRLLTVLGTGLTVGGATAVAGAIGFVGLVVPHLLRPLVGAQPSQLLPVSALGGAALLLAADLAVRLAAPERDLKLGVVTALVGAPFFIWLVLKNRQAAI